MCVGLVGRCCAGAEAEPLWKGLLPQQLREGFFRVKTLGSQTGSWETMNSGCTGTWHPPVLPVDSVRWISRSFRNGCFGCWTLPSVFGSLLLSAYYSSMMLPLSVSHSSAPLGGSCPAGLASVVEGLRTARALAAADACWVHAVLLVTVL